MGYYIHLTGMILLDLSSTRTRDLPSLHVLLAINYFIVFNCSALLLKVTAIFSLVGPYARRGIRWLVACLG